MILKKGRLDLLKPSLNFVKKTPKNVITIPIIGQLVRVGTSIGANYCEANGASSKKDLLKI